jgi:GTP diphosphokinase / guanosine-3',5'-bis(diphosphate) 3'-diphosphatase
LGIPQESKKPECALVSILAVEAGINDCDTLCAALLHDTIEDTDTSVEELVEAFGGPVASLVQEVTDDKRLPKAERKLDTSNNRTLLAHDRGMARFSMGSALSA